jgi:hypothetical protein
VRLLERWRAFWFAETPLVRLALFRIVVLALALADLIAYSHTALGDAQAVANGVQSKVWRPIYAFELLGLAPIDLGAARLVYACALVATGAGLVGAATRLALPLAALASLYWTGLVYSFGKPHHDKVALAFALLALACSPCGARLSLDAWLWRRRGRAPGPETSPFAGLPLRVTQVTIALGYCAAGLTKLARAGLEWANGYTLMATMMKYDNLASAWLSSHLELCRATSIVTLLTQATFPVVLVWPAARWYYLPASVAFHLATWWTMDTGPYITLWLLLVAFLPLERVPSWVAEPWRRGARAAALARGLVALVPATLVLWILWFYFPGWTLLPGLLGLVWIVRGLLRPVQRTAPALAASRPS